MSSILFTDSDGTWKLHNGKPFPASRFSSWTPDSIPVGDSVDRQSDGALTMFRVRDDFGVTFELPMIPSRRSSNLVLQSENFGPSPWQEVGTPTRTAAAHTASGIILDLIGDDDGAAREGYYQPITFTGDGVKVVSVFAKEGASPPAGGSRIDISDITAGTNRLTAQLAWVAGVPDLSVTVGTYLGAQLLTDGVYRLLFQTTAVTAANVNGLYIYTAITIASTGNIYVGGVQAENATTPSAYLHTTTVARTGMSLVDIADRLKRHLLNAEQCTVYTADATGTSYATCGLKRGTTPSLALSDRRAMEFTFSAHLINLAGSPVRLSAYYAEQ